MNDDDYICSKKLDKHDMPGTDRPHLALTQKVITVIHTIAPGHLVCI